MESDTLIRFPRVALNGSWMLLYTHMKGTHPERQYKSKKTRRLLFQLQHSLSNRDMWFWDPAGTYQTNHRAFYIGLNNKYGRYEWTDGSQLT